MHALGLMAEMVAARKPFVLATVVWRRGPSSGREGAKALITADGQIRGWMGGACAEPSVIKHALDALVDGRPRLLQLGPQEDFGLRSGTGVVAVPMACASEGAMEVYVEPVIPPPRLVVIGGSPGAEALVRMAEILGWGAVLVDDRGAGEAHPSVDVVRADLDLADLGIGERDFVVVATQGHYDEKALQAALETRAGYVGLVASRKRAANVFEFLRSTGVTDEAIARVHAPAGLDLGSLDNEEIAVAVLAEIVGLKARGGLATGVSVATPNEAVDPVCEMIVNVDSARWVSDFEGTTYYFCAPGCKKAFDTNPNDFVA